MKKRLLSIILAALFIISAMPFSASAEEGAVTPDIFYTLSPDGTLILRGTGEVYFPQNRSGEVKRLILYGFSSVPARAFADWQELTEVVFMGTVNVIGEQAFVRCPSLKKVSFNDAVTEIGVQAFAFCPKLETIALPSSVKKVGAEAFYRSGLGRVEIFCNAAFGARTFAECRSLYTVRLPEGMTEIPARMFFFCDQLREVNLPETVKAVREYAFSDCAALERLTLPEGLETVERHAFSGTFALKEVKIPSTLTVISEYVFYRSGLERLYLEDTVETLAPYSFAACASLADVYYNGTSDEWSGVSVAITNPAVARAQMHFKDDKRPAEFYSVTVNTSGRGKVTVLPVSTEAGKRVTVIVEPETGYGFKSIEAMTADRETVTLLLAGELTYTFTMPQSSVSINCLFTGSAPVFRDVPDTAYFAAPVKWAVENNVTAGTGDGLFEPLLTCTRAQVTAFLWRAAGRPAATRSAGFSDVPASAYYRAAVDWAVENGIVSGTGEGIFEPESTCTRAQIIAMLWRAAGRPSATRSAGFSDVPAGVYYTPAVDWAVERGITSGTGSGRFEPDGTCTRAEVVSFLYRHASK